MVVGCDFRVTSGFHQVADQADVLLAWRRVARRMIVDEDDRGRAELRRARHHLADVDEGLVDAPGSHSLMGQQHVLGVEE